MFHKVSAENVSEVQELFNQMTGEYYSEEEIEKRIQYLNSREKENLFIKYEHDQAVGMVGVKSDAYQDEQKKLAEVNVLVVKAKERGKGYGKELLDFAEKKAARENCDGVYLVSGFGRQTRAFNLYQNYGYKDAGAQMIKFFE